jgi:hypothetical protein
MVAVRVNGSEAEFPTGRLQKLTELIEFLKTSIDPSHMITAIRIDGRELDEQDWSASLGAYETAIMEVETDTPENFVAARIEKAPEVVRSMYLLFRDSRKAFQSGDMQLGNRRMIEAVNTARAFFEWYNSLLTLMPEESKSAFDINPQVREISEVCKRLSQQQLYQSWWALSETLEKELEPKLDGLEDLLRTFRRQAVG